MGININRREFLKSASLAIISAGVGSGCALKVSGQAVSSPENGYKRFEKVNVSRDRILRTVVGLRPYRPSGFIIKAEEFGEKTIIHNYGHGGSGVSLSWGTAQQAVDEVPETGERDYAVLGCGCIGLATARLLQKRVFDVTIYAKDFPPYTTSDAAGALWGPVHVADYEHHNPEFMKRFMLAARISHNYFRELGAGYGVKWIENYSFSGHTPEGPMYGDIFRDLFPGYRILKREEYPFDFPYALSFKTLLIEMPVYMASLMHDFLRAGGRLVKKEFKELADVISLSERVIMNCTGIGAKALFDDEEMIPIKGQLILLEAQPEVSYSAGSDSFYMIPRRDGILLGGTYEWGEWGLEPNEAEIERVMDAHNRFFNRMRL